MEQVVWLLWLADTVLSLKMVFFIAAIVSLMWLAFMAMSFDAVWRANDDDTRAFHQRRKKLLIAAVIFAIPVILLPQ